MHALKFALAILLLGAAPSPVIIRPPAADLRGETLVIPANSAVRFKGWDKYGYAVFDGRFRVTGTFTYGCDVDCQGPVAEDDISLDFVPDAAFAMRLPHWATRTNKISLSLSNERSFAQSIVGPKLRSAIRAGQIPYVRGRATIVVENFRTGIECDSASFLARFVRVVAKPTIEPVDLQGDYGCA